MLRSPRVPPQKPCGPVNAQAHPKILAPDTIAEERRLAELVAREEDFLAAVKEFAEKTIELRRAQAEFDEDQSRLDARMVGVIAFGASSEMFRAFLDERELNALLISAQKDEDLHDLEDIVNYMEQSPEFDDVDTTSAMNVEIERENAEEELLVMNMETNNVARRMSSSIKAAMRQTPPQVAPIAIEARPRLMSSREVLEVEMQLVDAEVKRADDMARLTEAHQVSLDILNAEVDSLTHALAMGANDTREQYAEKDGAIAKLLQKVKENDDLQTELVDLEEQNAQLRLKLAVIADGKGRVKRETGTEARRQQFSEDAQQRNQDLQARVESSTQVLAKRLRRLKKKRDSHRTLTHEIEETEMKCDVFRDDIIGIEREVQDTEMQLNGILKQTMELACNAAVDTEQSVTAT